MSQIIQTQEEKMKSSFIEFVKKECVLVIALTKMDPLSRTQEKKGL